MTDGSDEVYAPTFPPLPDGQYKTVLADPPWRYDDDLPGDGRGADTHYETLTPQAVAGLGPQIRKITAPQAHLYLWTTNSFIADAHEVAEAWGFDPKTILTWNKPQMGMGHYFRNCTEHVVFGVKGNLNTVNNDVLTSFTADRTAHSSKPTKLYEIAETQSYEPRIELFAREPRQGWDAWGKEVDDVEEPVEVRW